jgi:hypothetical protein
MINEVLRRCGIGLQSDHAVGVLITKDGDGGRTGTAAVADRPQLALLCEEFSATLVTSPQPPNASFPALLPSLVRQAHKTKVSAGQLLSWTQLALREKAVLALVQYKALTDSSGYSNPGLIGPCYRVFVLGFSKYHCFTGTRPGYSQARLQRAIQVFNTWKRGGLTSRVYHARQDLRITWARVATIPMPKLTSKHLHSSNCFPVQIHASDTRVLAT